MARIQLSIVTPQRHLIDREADEVVAPGFDGEFGVLPEHDLYLIALGSGEVVYQDGGERGHYAISGGFAEVGPNRITILAETAEEAAEIDLARATRSKEDAEKILGGDHSSEEYDEARARLERAVARMNVATRI